jgi:hypothetical protein
VSGLCLILVELWAGQYVQQIGNKLSNLVHGTEVGGRSPSKRSWHQAAFEDLYRSERVSERGGSYPRQLRRHELSSRSTMARKL